ncbi:MAG: hypothetical protein V4760_06185 [Bdellovibrionota bacterium]
MRRLKCRRHWATIVAKCAVSVLVLGSSLEVRAEFKVVDEKGIVEDLRRWSRPGSFETVMACGQTATVEATTPNCDAKCGATFCQTKCSRFQTPTGKDRYDLHVDDCSAGVAHVYGDNGLIVQVSREEFDQGAGTFLIPFLRQASQYLQPEGEIHLNWMWPTSTQFIDDGQVRTISAFIVEADVVYPGSAQTLRIRTVWTDQLPGARQLLLFKLGQDDIFLKARGLVGEITP